ncbi:hypothetical protein C0J52_28059 [Blattella germanica]|nr:hypothetical protein C0J52_28059 [Blattella germanica]
MSTNWYKMAAIMNRYCENDGIEEVWKANSYVENMSIKKCGAEIKELELAETEFGCWDKALEFLLPQVAHIQEEADTRQNSKEKEEEEETSDEKS